MAVDIVIQETIDLVDITVNPNIININVTRTSGGGGVQTVTGTTVDDSDPLNPIVGVPNLTQVLTVGDKIFDSISANRTWIIADRLKYWQVQGGIQTLDDSADTFPAYSLIEGVIQNDDINATVTFDFVDTPCFYLNQNITTITLNVGDSFQLKKGGGAWILSVCNKSTDGGGAVDSVNGQTGVVVLDTSDISDTTNKRYVTDAQQTVLGNTSGTNTGDNATNSTSNAYADGKVTDAIVNGVTTVAPSQNAVFDALALKTDKTDWVDYTSLSTIVGWSSFTANKFIWYKIIDGIMFVNFYLEGTSNATNATFTLPNSNTIASFSLSAYIVNNGAVTTNQVGRIFVPSGSATVTVNRDNVGTAYTASGTKTIAGQFFIKL